MKGHAGKFKPGSSKDQRRWYGEFFQSRLELEQGLHTITLILNCCKAEGQCSADDSASHSGSVLLEQRNLEYHLAR
jgi:hypothetical protein